MDYVRQLKKTVNSVTHVAASVLLKKQKTNVYVASRPIEVIT